MIPSTTRTRSLLRGPLFARALAAGFLASACLAAALASAEGAKPSAPLSVTTTSLRSSKGRVGCTLYAGPGGFPVDPTRAIQLRWCPIDAATSTCRFDPIPQGTYAVACFHDENADGKLDTGLFGIPTEGTVVSNHAKGTFGPPSFDDAKFAFDGHPTELTLHISY